MRQSGLLKEVFSAHGGRRWQSVKAVNASFSSGGLAFASRMQPFALKQLHTSIVPHSRHVTLSNYCHPGWSGIWTPTLVQILNENGTLVAERHNPRSYFSRIGKNICWDKLDLLYFVGYALWNYLCFPFILDIPGVTIEIPEEAVTTPLRHLIARFDSQVPTHSTVQTFYIDESGLLSRHDYTADVIGRWASAANYCLASEQVQGFRFYTRRRVLPRIGSHVVFPIPTLVWIEIDDLSVHTAAQDVYVRNGGNTH